MLEFLKKKKNIPVIVQVKELIESSIYPKEVQAIHHEFENASTKLLEEARLILSNPSAVNVDKIKQLTDLGFTQATEVKDSKYLIEEMKLSKKQIELINSYNVKFPGYKFITEQQVRLICHKYNLVCGNINRFKGFVPNKNLKDITDFKANAKITKTLTCIDRDGNTIIVEGEVRLKGGYNHLFKVNDDDDRKYAYQAHSPRMNRFYGQDRYNLFPELAHLEDFTVDNTLGSNLKICAPVKDMDISGLELVEGYKLVKKHIPDPVVLQPIKGGYLILTAWGDEASDPLVVNEKSN